MSIKITVSEKVLRDSLVSAVSDLYHVDNCEEFGEWMFVRYFGNRADLENDLSEQLGHSSYNVGISLLNLVPDPDELRLDWFRHNHRDQLLTLAQAVHLIQMGYELWVCNYNADQEIDLFTTVTVSDFDEDTDESLTEWLKDMKAWAK